MNAFKATAVRCCAAAISGVLASVPAWAGTEGLSNTFYGIGAGAHVSTGTTNSFFGNGAGNGTLGGSSNTAVGYGAGWVNTSGNRNVYLGYGAGNLATGSGSVFLGHFAGYPETGSNRLYIDNCLSGGMCNHPFIYGEFDNHLLRINGVVNVAANAVAKSQLHISLAGADTGGWLTSVGDNNFFTSSGASYEAAAGGWIQKSPDGKAVLAGSGGTGYRIFTSTGGTPDAAVAPVPRFQIDYAGNFGINAPAVAGTPIYTGTTAYLSAGGVWMNASSRERKENIRELSIADALGTLAALNPVTYNYKADSQERHVGFIAEDVPELVASKDRRGLSAMDIVAVLTKVVQEQKQAIRDIVLEQNQDRERLTKRIDEIERERTAQAEEIAGLKATVAEVAQLKQQLAHMARLLDEQRNASVTAGLQLK